MKSYLEFLQERSLKLTLQYHDKLNPAIWQNDKLKPLVKQTMMQYAKLFIEFAGIPKSDIKDIIFTGSNTNRNYTKFSDCDVHIITNMKSLSSDALYNKKLQWEAKNKRLKVAGYPLEFFAQDAKEALPADQGQYSLLKDTWLSHPAELKHTEILNDPLFKKKVSYYIHQINKMILIKDKAGLTNLKQKFHQMRTAGLQKAGEFSYENSLYKELRNRGLITKINNVLK